MLAVDVGVTFIEEVSHLLHGVEVFREPGWLYLFESKPGLGDIEGKPVCSFDGLEVSTNSGAIHFEVCSLLPMMAL